MSAIEFEGRLIATDERGYLLERADWSARLADHLAARDGITLDAGHWEVLNLLREHYDAFRIAPPMRLLVKEIGRRFGAEKASSRYLYRLFPDGPAKQGCRYAGLPRPVSCI
jgi:tRNA 2-thiouridine synthesizing protein E